MDRRKFLGALGATAAAPGLAGAAARGQGSGSRPNLVVILADDMGYSDIGGFGAEIETPNLDRLAGEGLRFTNFYNAARCCPSRASLLTGLYPHQAGVGHMTADEGDPAYQGYLNRQCVTIAEALKPAGYHTLMAGKWHVGHAEGRWPVDRGFDEYYGFLRGSSNYFKPTKQSGLARNHDLVEAPDGFYSTDAFTTQAIDWLQDLAQKDRDPYFLYLAFNAPHWPLQAPREDIEKYEGRYLAGWDRLRAERHERMIDLGVIDPAWPLTPRDRATPPWITLDPHRKKRLAAKMAVYAAQVDRMDQNIGRLLAAIERSGQADNTLILFLSDNGACHEFWYTGFPFNPTYVKLGKAIGAELGTADSFASYGRGWANLGNTPFKLHKHWTHEGGISTPLLAHWPRTIRQPGETTREVGHLIDIMATCLDAAGAAYPAERDGEAITPLEGKSLIPVLETGARDGHEILGWEHEGNRAIRAEKWKIVSDYPGRWSLHDMETDRVELTNLARQEPARFKELIAAYKDYAARIGARPWNPLRSFQY